MNIVPVPEREWKRLLTQLDKLERIEDEQWLTEKEAAEFLGVELKTFRNDWYNKKIPATSYKLTYNNKRVFKRSTLIKPI